MENAAVTPSLRIALVGDYNADVIAHQAIPLAIDDAAAVLDLAVEYVWLATEDIKSADDLAHGLLWTLYQADSETLSANAREKVLAEYSQQKIADQYKEIYANG